MPKHQFAKTLEQFPPRSVRAERRTPTSIARKQRLREEAVPEERIEITDPVLERHALRVGWELTEQLGIKGGRTVKFVAARAIYRILDLEREETEEDREAVFELTRTKRVSGILPVSQLRPMAHLDEAKRCEERRLWSRRHLLCVRPESACCQPRP